jgi:hypothetical protein
MEPIKVYMRVGDHPEARDVPYKVAASVNPNYTPLKVGSGFSERYLPTVMFAVEFEIPESMMFAAAQTLAVIKVPEKAVEIAAAVSYPEED